MILKCEVVSDVGCLRDNNEDMALLNGEYYRDESSEQSFELAEKSRFIAIVADGMGGCEGGEFASDLATQHFDTFVNELPEGLSFAELKEATSQWTTYTHKFITDKGIELPQYEGMGTTLTGLFGYDGGIFMINIGDSRLYRYRNGILKQLSTDHSMRELTGDMDAPSNQIYNSLGAGDSAFADLQELTGQLLDGDILIVCSDGLSDMLTDEQIRTVIEQRESAADLVEAAKKAGGRDNVTVIVMKVIDTAPQTEQEETEPESEIIAEPEPIKEMSEMHKQKSLDKKFFKR